MVTLRAQSAVGEAQGEATKPIRVLFHLRDRRSRRSDLAQVFSVETLCSLVKYACQTGSSASSEPSRIMSGNNPTLACELP
jgi:hypothetical protein